MERYVTLKESEALIVLAVLEFSLRVEFRETNTFTSEQEDNIVELLSQNLHSQAIDQIKFNIKQLAKKIYCEFFPEDEIVNQ